MFAVLFSLSIAAVVVAILAVFVRAVVATNASIQKSGLGGRPDAAQRTIAQIRGRDVRCPRCGGQGFALLGRDRRWMCEGEQCRTEFEGPEHLPAEAA